MVLGGGIRGLSLQKCEKCHFEAVPTAKSDLQPVWLAENSADRHMPLAKSPKRSRVLDTCIRHTREPLRHCGGIWACPGYDRAHVVLRSGAGVMSRSDGKCERLS